MFGLFKKKTELEKLNDQYKKLMKQSYLKSTINRTESDALLAEANKILNQMEVLKKQN
jgi:hypothetical protein|tara:strand:+ start:2760 stop:2933 length:174 start_codon:yes stop_codon:yes gene_type:complete